MPNPKKNVLQIAYNYAPPFTDLLKEYARLFPSDQFRVTTVFLSGDPKPEVLPEDCGDVIFLNATAGSLRGLKLKTLFELAKITRQQAFDFVIAHRYKSVYMASYLKLMGLVPNIVGVAHEFGLLSRPSRWLLAKVLKKHFHVIGISNAISHGVRQDAAFLNPEQVVTLHNCVDVDRLRQSQVDRGDARAHLGAGEQDFVFGSVGRLIEKKNHSELVEAFAACEFPSSVKLVIIGVGRLEAGLKALIEKHQLTHQILLLGRVEEAARYFRAFDAFVLPSKQEPFGMVTLEAMAADVPVLAYDSGASAELLTDCGVLVNPSVADLSIGLASMVDMPEERRQLLVESAQTKLRDCFSSAAFRDAFWKSSLVKLIH